MSWKESELLQQYMQQYSCMKDCEAQEILWQSSLSETKAPQYERVVNGLGLLLVDFSTLRKIDAGLPEIQWSACLRQARSVWSVSFIWLFGFSGSCNKTNQIDQMNQTDRTDQMNKTGWRTFSAAC